MNRYRGEIKAVNLNCLKKKVTVTLEFTNDHNAIVDEDALARLADNPVWVSFESAQEQMFDDRTGPKDENQTELLDEEDDDFEVIEGEHPGGVAVKPEEQAEPEGMTDEEKAEELSA